MTSLFTKRSPYPLETRRREPELMDNTLLDPELHVEALDGLARINCFTGGDRLVWEHVAALVRREGLSRLSIMDVGTGGGDVPIGLCRRAARRGLEIRVTALDRSATALALARQRARCAGVSIDFLERDVLKDALPTGFDVVTCSLFLHHMSDCQAPIVLKAMAKAAGRLLVVSDLGRSVPGYVSALFGTRLLSHSAIVHKDGPLSVRAAFTPAEVRIMARQAGLSGATVLRRFPFRWVMTWMPR